ncbi:MAG: tRNA (adenosine(37)-N6)-threonylcarbamoyltransferase complex ATPase subunit type 1 TsaE [Mucilaginibacter sp.]|uniref:tRNA (adenosine(37)-N6)-threonylcarbamoyltransferase complex ATPase subunit type 1 TsaE n=1 Tax=Mucilaginibacter sp. TaxID=1882438 RepID=UPI003263BC11
MDNSIIYTLNDISQVAQKLLAVIGDQKIFLFHGDMGAGKTTLIKELCKELGVTDNVTSPTFSLVNEYTIPTGKIYHFDFYRLKNQTEALDMGCEEYFYSGDYCFIEWPTMIPDLIPDGHINISIKVLSGTEREIHIG